MSYEGEINHLRKEINRINLEIVESLSERVEVAQRIAEVKRRHGKPIRDAARENNVLDSLSSVAENRGLDPVGVRRVFREIIELCVRAEEKE